MKKQFLRALRYVALAAYCLPLTTYYSFSQGFSYSQSFTPPAVQTTQIPAPFDMLGQTYPGGANSWDQIQPNNWTAVNGILNNTGNGVIDYVNKRLWIPDNNTANFPSCRVLGYQLNSSYQRLKDYPDWILGKPDIYQNSNTRDQYSLGQSGHCQLAWSPSLQYLFVPDAKNNRVLIFDMSKGVYTGMPAVVVLAQNDFYTGTGWLYVQKPGNTVLNNPTECFYDESNQRLFIDDDGDNRIVVIDGSHGFYSNMAFSNVLLQFNFTSDTSSVAPQAFCAFSPEGLYYWQSKHWLFSVQNRHSRVLIWDLSGGITNGMNATYVLGQANFTSGSANRGGSAGQNTLNAPRMAFVDEKRHVIWIADGGNNRVMGYNADSIANGMNATWVIGQPNFTSTGTNLTQSGFNNPVGLTYDTVTKELSIGDVGNQRMVDYPTTVLASSGNFNSVWGGQSSFTVNNFSWVATSNPPCINGGISSPGGMSLDKKHRLLWVCDNVNNRVLGFPLSSVGTYASRLATVVLGQNDFVSNSANKGGSAGQSTLFNPIGVFFDTTRKYLFVADGGAANGRQPRVMVWDLSGTITSGMNASWVLGQPDFTTTSAGITNAKLSAPWGVYVTAAGIVYISDINRVVTTDISGGITNGQVFTHVLGQADFTHNAANRGGSTAANTFSTATGVYVAEDMNLVFVSDFSNNRLTGYDISGGIEDGMNATYFIGQSTSTGNTNLGQVQNALVNPLWLARDSARNLLYVANRGNSDIVGFALAQIATGMNACKVYGMPNFMGGVNVFLIQTRKYFIGTPQGMAIDNKNGYMYAASQSDNKIFQYILK